MTTEPDDATSRLTAMGCIQVNPCLHHVLHIDEDGHKCKMYDDQ